MLPKDSIFHCALYIDIAVEPQFGNDTNRFVSQIHRKLQCRHPKILSKYKECLKKKLAHQTITERVDAFLAVPIGSWTKNHTTALNKLDVTLGDSQEFAERKCNKGKRCMLDWSEELSHAGKIVSYW
jgi:hypothetical protein